MSMWRKVFFFPSLAYNLAAEKVTSRRWYDRLDEHVILGALPFRSVLAELKKKENLKGVISFNEDYELNQLWYPTLQEYADVGVEFLQLPVLDYVGVPNRQQVQKALEFIDKIAAENGTVYVHCKAGRFRSAYFAAAYVIKSQGLDAISAVEFVHGKRSQVWLGPKEKQSLQLFHNELYPDRPEKVEEKPVAPDVPENPIF
ncbi:phosphatidylglycerophosphatase and protein-tyrosine phosphatase 1-like isoform X2 [Paramacrobiotus metropolitanus]|nr:phosphatidylglycerophosphatase and protein-tyrosine phosphatase 1-like isoform X2 [Paramacrobiotus metropolitanus]XP_055342831.1 phosphatidylglycerophosphatase and protein-tyrosine phosphatase 1-like isoform X2 [Paramacrobiotus metropolitanus]XP_055342832.1 phosphatidylglycerophosphatase and protein-tyrosine phosphatase 1-like isoform X2 [Paramacrobiotus metropolitanus]XP_055342833.1 phosphatidylglycerophosphatase and protein-tyrosine phosphatase 1-like isoform X2 [Paramacrobiotus metropolita